MENENILIFVATLSLLFGLSLILVAFYFFQYKHQKNLYKTERKARLENLPPDLELATSEQLYKELRGRGFMYILLTPDGKDLCKIKIESSGLAPTAVVDILKMAAKLLRKEVEKQSEDHS